ncbi:MAG TPA: hypothetical protein VG028_01345 [Terriglobia bacterium]|nr:hypothetical protein [Terriglobia bacterium]
MVNRFGAILLGMSMGLSGAIARGASAAPSRMGGAAWHGQDRGDARRGSEYRRWRQDDEERGRGNPHRFRDRDRRAAHEWYGRHRQHPPEGFRQRDWLAPEYESRLRVGYVLDPDMRRMCRPVPYDLLQELPPCPRRYRYVVIGGHICLLDRGYRVHDVIHLEVNFR